MISRLLAFAVGLGGTVWMLSSVVRSVVIPRPERVWITVTSFAVSRSVSHWLGSKLPAWLRHKVLGGFAPSVLIALPLIWSGGLIASFSCFYWALGVGSWQESLEFSGSSITTLGFIGAPNTAAGIFAVIEALIGLGIVALMISFLPALYGTFSRREIAVGKLATRASTPANPVTFLTRLTAIDQLHNIEETWGEWEDWFVELGETHTSFPALVYFRSASPDRSWLTTAETALDTAAMVKALCITTGSGEADLMIRSGYKALREIADFYRIAPEAEPGDFDSLSVSHQQFHWAVEELTRAGVIDGPIPDGAWEAFAGWRINYDRAMVGLRELIGDLPDYWMSEATKHHMQ